MRTPTEVILNIKKYIKKEWKIAFWTAFLCGLLVHMPMLLSDIPNHDGLDSMYFDQNMITSGRWFLMAACGLTSFYTLPWLIGVLAIIWISVAAVFLAEFLEVKDKCCIALISGLLVTFPAVASTFAYVFTMDGYMLGLALAVASVLCVKKRRFGFLPGAVCLAFSLGIYQAYLPFAVILSIYGILELSASGKEATAFEKIKSGLRYLYMGVLGFVLYYGILQLLLRIQGKELDTYQGISGLEEGPFAGGVDAIINMAASMYRDFFAFSLKGNVLINNGISLVAVAVIAVVLCCLVFCLILRNQWWKRVWFYILLVLAAIGIPIAADIILFVSPGVTYHLLMRYQWVLFLILPIAFVERFGGKAKALWGITLAGVLLVGNFAVTDNIAYGNLMKRYEKTYAYCLRLLDRIEQTPGYYQGIPVAMIGVVGDESYPATDITQDVTSNMIGMNGDVLLYTGDNYEIFIRNYLGATLNILPTEVMEEIYYSEEYRKMDSFPGENSVKLVDGIIYVKTENIDRTEVK